MPGGLAAGFAFASLPLQEASALPSAPGLSVSVSVSVGAALALVETAMPGGVGGGVLEPPDAVSFESPPQPASPATSGATANAAASRTARFRVMDSSDVKSVHWLSYRS